MATITNPTPNPNIDVGVDSDRAEFEAAQRRPVKLSFVELAVGIVALVIWFCLFTGGLLIATQTHREAIGSPTVFWPTVTSWLVVIAFWTITNVGLLSCVAAYLGALGRRAHFTYQTDSMRPVSDATQLSHERLATYYLSAVLRGFGVYTLILGGLFVLATSLLASPSQEEYMRLAPTVSIISFYAGYDPSIFAGLLDRAKAFLQSKN